MQDSQQWRTQLVCLFWDWLLLESNHGSLLTSILFRLRRDQSSRSNLVVTVHCLAMEGWLYFLHVLGLREGTWISEYNRVQAILKPFLLSSTFRQHWYQVVKWPMWNIGKLLLHFIRPISCIVWLLCLAFINNLVVMDSCIFFSINLLTVSK